LKLFWHLVVAQSPIKTLYVGLSFIVAVILAAIFRTGIMGAEAGGSVKGLGLDKYG
jgi:hypothetical protein